MQANFKIFKYCFKQMIKLEIILVVLFASLLLHTAVAQFDVITYIVYFEGYVAIIVSMLFINIINMPYENGMDQLENKAQFSTFITYIYRNLSCLIASVVIYWVVYIEYAILFFGKIDIYENTIIEGTIYTNVGIFKVFVAFMISVFVLTRIYVLVNIIVKNKYIALAMMFFFYIASLVERGLPFNFLSLYFRGDKWISTKLFWIVICIMIDIVVNIRCKIKGKILNT